MLVRHNIHKLIGLLMICLFREETSQAGGFEGNGGHLIRHE